MEHSHVEIAAEPQRKTEMKVQSVVHICNACRRQFGPGEGIKITDEKFCTECECDLKHIDFYRRIHAKDYQIALLLDCIIKL